MTHFSYERNSDGTDETFDVLYPDGSHLVSVPFWDGEERAESQAKLIVDALNAYHAAA